MNIPDEAVEAALEAMEDMAFLINGELGTVYRHDAIRAALEAAAPFLMGQAWDEGAESTRDFQNRFWAAEDLALPPANPYRAEQ